MSAVDETLTELDDVRELLERDEARRAKAAEKAPAGFDPACVFLLKQMPDNLFEPTGREYQLRCKGCGRSVVLWNRKKHFDRHVQQLNEGLIEKEAAVAKTAGKKEQQARERREESAAKAEGETAPAELPEETVEAVSEAEKPARAKPAPPAAKEGDDLTSRQVFDKLIEQLEKKVPGLETKANEKVGYVSIKSGGNLIGYGWLTTKADLRVEAAIEPSDIPADERVVKCNRSKDMAARTRIGNDKAGYDLAVKMLTAAAKKQAAAKKTAAAK